MSLSILSPVALRAALAKALAELPLAQVSWQLGQQADSPSSAFFIAYQAAMRCLDPMLEPHCWAAFGVSEQGIKSPWQCNTEYDPVQHYLAGEKSYVMLANGELDRLYVLAKKAAVTPVELVLLKLAAEDLDVIAAKPAVVMAEVPHFSVRFALQLEPTAVFMQQAHAQANKPFRYWEDNLVAIALAGWLQGQLLTPQPELESALKGVINCFDPKAKGYDLAGLAAVEDLLAKAQQAALSLPAETLKQWQQDTLLLQFTAPIRAKIKQQLQLKQSPAHKGN